MNGKQWTISIVLMIVAAFLGGAVSSWLFSTQPVYASKYQTTDVVETKELRIVDNESKVRIKLSMEDGDPYIKLFESVWLKQLVNIMSASSLVKTLFV